MAAICPNLLNEGSDSFFCCRRAEKKLYLDRRVVSNKASRPAVEKTEENSGNLMSTLKFGCNAVFGQGLNKNRLPSDDEISLITDRTRTEDFSAGNLKGGADANAEEFDASKPVTESTIFGGIDFKKIRDEYKNSHHPEDIAKISDMWKKRQRKDRIKFIQSKNSAWGSKDIPILASNDYSLESGERSIFQQELRGRSGGHSKKKKAGPQFEMLDHCQKCGDGGFLVGCPRCPVALHLECAGISHEKYLACCSHHHCAVCKKATSNCGGFIFPCTCCTNAFCEDHLPAGVRFLDGCEMMEKMNYRLKNGVYIHCSKICEAADIAEFGYQVPGNKPRPPCPPALDLSSHFGGEVDDSLDAPESYIATNKRRRHAGTTNGAQDDDSGSELEPSTGVANDVVDDRKGKRSKDDDEPYDPEQEPEEESDVDEQIECPEAWKAIIGTRPAAS